MTENKREYFDVSLTDKTNYSGIVTLMISKTKKGFWVVRYTASNGKVGKYKTREEALTECLVKIIEDGNRAGFNLAVAKGNSLMIDNFRNMD